MAIEDVAQGLVDLCKSGKFEEAMAKYYSDDIVSVEPSGPDPESVGIAAVKAKSQWWSENMEMHSVEVEGPYINGDQFAVKFTMDITPKASGQRMTAAEIGIYTVKDDKVVHERFFDND